MNATSAPAANRLARLGLVLLLVGAVLPAGGASILVPAGAVWKYLDNGSDQGAAWRAPAFDDSAWRSGPAELGYGDGDEATLVGFGPSTAAKYITAYFRHRFEVADPAAVSNLTVRLVRDDGAVVYLNGVEVFRNNLPAGPITYNTLAALATEDETLVFNLASSSPGLLVSGANVVAVEVHQVNPASSDLSFDLELLANGVRPNELPSVTVVAARATTEEVDPRLDRPEVPGVFRISRTGATTQPLRVQYEVGGTARAGTDYVQLPASVEIPAGAAAADVLVQVVDDLEVEPTETVVLRVLPPPCPNPASAEAGCYLVGQPAQATVSILDDDTSTNLPPTVGLVSPADGAVFLGPTNVLLVAQANDPNGYLTIQTVEFFAGDKRLGVRTNLPVLNPLGPFVLNWENVQPAEYILTAVATDDRGAKGTSAPVRISVRSSDPMAPVTLVATGSVWKYLDNGSDQGVAWRSPDFDDSAWAAGPGQLGYGDGDEATAVNSGPDPLNRYITTYFRRAFEVADAASVRDLTLRLLRDDGVVLYLNGTEVFRNNLPSGPINHLTLALTAAGPDENAYLAGEIPASLLVNGRNVLAAEVHQVSAASTDLGFDLALTGNRGPRPPERTVINVVALDPQAGEPGPANFPDTGRFAIQRTGNLDTAVTVYFTLGGTAANGSDYLLVSNQLVVPAGFTQIFVPIVPLSDDAVEGTENVVLALQPPVCIAIYPPPPECYLVGSAGQATVFIQDATPPPTNTPPFVQLNTPQNGAVFRAPAEIRLEAYAQDREDGYELRVEFFEGDRSLGPGTFVPTLCPAPHCPFYALTWSNVPPGSYLLRARATDASGANTFSEPVRVTVEPNPGTNITLVARGAVWRYHDVAPAPDGGWTQPPYDDSAWSAGPAQLGYGDGDEATVVGSGSDPFNRPVTAYFRRSFEVANPAGFVRIAGRLLQDDGAAVYLNGVEVFRSNLPPGPVTPTMLAVAVVENQLVEFSLPGHVLLAGRNVVAVEMHQVNVTSSDLSFDLELVGETGPRPPELPVVNVFATDPNAAETGALGSVDPGAFTFRRSGNLDHSLVVTFALGGTAVNGVDYLRLTNRVEFAPGAAEVRLNVIPLNDNLLEPVENVVVLLPAPLCAPASPPPPGCYDVGPAHTATVFIADYRPPVNQLPTVSLVSPTDGTLFPEGAEVRLEAVTRDPDGYANHAEFFANGVKIGEATILFIQAPPPGEPIHLEFTWANPPAGRHVLTVRTRDDRGAVAVSAPVTITVGPPPVQPARRNQEQPAVAASSNLYLVAWADQRDFNDNEWDIYAARVTSEGRVLDPNGIRICALPGIQNYPTVASDGRDFLVVWTDGRKGVWDGEDFSTQEFDIYAARVTAAGAVLEPNGFPVSEAPSSQFVPSVAFNGTDYLAAWYDYRNSDTQRIRNDIFGARVSRSGQVLDPDGLAISVAEGMQWGPGVAALGGDFFVAWDDAQPGEAILGSRVTAAGVVTQPGGTLLSPHFSGYPIRLAANATGCLVVWTDGRDYENSRYNIYARRVNAAGEVLGTADLVLSSAPEFQVAPAVAAHGDEFLAVWIDTRSGDAPAAIVGTRVGPAGALDVAGIPIGRTPYNSSLFIPGVASLPGQYLVAWVGGPDGVGHETDIVAARLSAAGAVLDAEPFLVSTEQALADSDGDGVADYRDRCPNTPAGAIINAHGCSLDQLCRCDGPWPTHADYVRCVIRHSWEFYRAGLLTAEQRRARIYAAIQSNCGKRPGITEPVCLLPLPLTPEECRRDGLQFILCGDATGGCVIECSTNLIHWTTVENSAVAITGWETVCPAPVDAPVRFYRVRLIPTPTP